jgi:farnesyl-diphosphate farnesyltransferase/isopentenyl-diphosphate delta-isomerase type 1
MPSKSKQWDGDLSQEDFMIKDECIVLDRDDNVIGNANKKKTHIFDKKNPRGILHRAFSVFLFDKDGRMLLQQRAAEKITFPNVWTNTCCSHPLHGYSPSEVDTPEDVENASVMGVKRAAIRKLDQELGIKAKQVPIKKFKFLTRLHYWAADVVTHGPKAPWGEHEIDYILFIQADVKVKPNPEEVMDYKYVTLPELQSMMNPSSGLLWSPWFRIIAEKFLIPFWWNDLKTTLTTDKWVDVNTIYRFDPTTEHMGGSGNAGAWLGDDVVPYGITVATTIEGDTSKKQGAYGKVPTHKHSKLSQAIRIDEVFSALWLVYGPTTMENKVEHTDDDVKYCDEMLGKVSRSFASVIRQLPKGLCLDILIFYLALRGLDTIEDDMQAFIGRENEKIEELNNFYRTGLEIPEWKMDGVGEKDEKKLLQEFYRCGNVFRSLPADSQNVISDITRRMGEGMANFVQIDLGQGTVTIEDYNLYCHYVAGLVGEGLSRLFYARNYEGSLVNDVSKTLANTMGLFLQKTNIIRDYLEDYVDGRAFWPQEIWKGYTTSGNLGEFAESFQNKANSKNGCKRAMNCLNHLVTDALECVPECLQYMTLLNTQEVFRFCAIPQVMAIATLNELYDNERVFTGVVKIRKGLAAKMVLNTNSVNDLHYWFNIMAKSILKKVNPDDPMSIATVHACEEIIRLTAGNAWSAKKEGLMTFFLYTAPLGMGLTWLKNQKDEIASYASIFTVACVIYGAAFLYRIIGPKTNFLTKG